MLQQALSSNKMRVAFFIGAGCPMSIRVSDGTDDKPIIPDIRTITQKIKDIIGKDDEDKNLSKILAEVTEFFREPNNVTIEDILSHIRLLTEIVQRGKVGEIDKDVLGRLDKRICEIITKLVSVQIPLGSGVKSPYHQFASWIAATPVRLKPIEFQLDRNINEINPCIIFHNQFM